VKPGQKGYEDKFSYVVWWELADTILQSVQFLDPAYEKTVKTIDKLKVKCQQIYNLQASNDPVRYRTA